MGTSIEEDGYKGFSVISLPSKKDKREETSSGLLEDVATCFILFTRSCTKKLAALPFPVGAIIKTMEELAHPFVHPVERFSLQFLAAVDDQIYGVGTTLEGYVVCLRSRGLIGMSADIWVHFEAGVRERMQSIIDVASKIPLVGRITPLVCAISAPLGNAVSQWLVQHSQSTVKRIQSLGTERKKETEGLEEPKEIKAGGDFELLTEVMEEAVSKKADAGHATPAKARRGASEHKSADVKKTQYDDKDVSAVLELIDSGWLLGSKAPASPKLAALPKMSAITAPQKASASAVAPTPAAATATPKQPANPKKPANPKSRRKH